MKKFMQKTCGYIACAIVVAAAAISLIVAFPFLTLYGLLGGFTFAETWDEDTRHGCKDLVEMVKELFKAIKES